MNLVPVPDRVPGNWRHAQPVDGTQPMHASEIIFRRPFALRTIAQSLPPGKYLVETGEELILGVSFAAYRRISTMLYLPAGATAADALQFALVDPNELAEAQRLDAMD